MNRSPEKPEEDWSTGPSPIARPDHVHAIGMISIEMADLEASLGGLLGALLHISPGIGRLVYLSPRAALSRIAVLERVLDVTLKDGRKRTLIEKNLVKAKAILWRRNDLMHGHWGLSEISNQAEVYWHDLPFSPKRRPSLVPLSELTEFIDNIRTTSENLRTIAEDLYSEWPPYSSRPKQRKRQHSSTKS